MPGPAECCVHPVACAACALSGCAGPGPAGHPDDLDFRDYGGEQPASADHVERFYFTRELGSTRWERWQNLEHSRDFSADRLTKAAADLASSGRCSQAQEPSGGARFVMIDCREWTRIVPPDKSGGDPPGFFIAAVRSRNLAAGLFAAPQQ